MAGGWPILSLREASVSLIDCEHRTPPASEHGYPYVAIPQVKDGRINLNGVRRITRKHFDEWTRKAHPEPFDVVLSRRCNPGETGFVPRGLQFALGQNLVLLRSDGTKIFKPFLRWLVRGPQWWEQVGMYINVGAVFDSLKCADIPGFGLPVPPLPEQRAIAHILGTLDNKIELNRQMNHTLEEVARALFKSWFVDFDPVHAKATLKHATTIPQGRSEWSVERARAFLDKMAPDFAALFPDSFVDSELGPIPAGWVAGCFGDITAQRKQRIGARAAVVLSAVRTGRLVRSEEHFTKQVHSKRITNYLAVQHGDIAYNPSRINIGSVGMFKEAVLGAVSPVYVVARPESAYRSFLEFALQLAQTKQWITVLATGSVRQSLSYVDFASIPCAIPPLSAVEEFEGQWNRLREVTVTRSEEVLALTALRDVLLPKLLSGKVRVSGGVEIWSR